IRIDDGKGAKMRLSAFFNIYGPQSARIRLDLWTGISNLVDSMESIWIAMGDFKVVRSRSERASSRFDANEAFNDSTANVSLRLLGCLTHGSVMRNSALSRSWPIYVLEKGKKAWATKVLALFFPERITPSLAS
ncbi:hypothetical protein Tco_0386872, partial [Tanacetum coccineum]